MISSREMQKKLRRQRQRMTFVEKLFITTIATIFLAVFFMPLAYGFFASLKTEAVNADSEAPLMPSSPIMYNYNGTDYPVYDLNYYGKTQRAALIEKGMEESKYVLIDTPNKEVITQSGYWRLLKRKWKIDFKWSNYVEAATLINLPKLMLNTFIYAFFSTIGMVISSSLVAFGFARFNFPGKKYLFGVVLATIILPPSITLIPTYTFFYKIGLVGTWWPLILPAYFANAFNIFLLRQYFMGVPKECDEAAMIDGASYLRIFYSIIIPQSLPAFIAVGLFHFFFCWNDFFGPLIYLTGHPEKYPISIGLTQFMAVHTREVNLIQATSIMSIVIPVLIFFFFQKYFTKGLTVGSSGEN